MLTAVLLALQVSAAGSPEFPIAILNVQRLVAESATGKADSARLESVRRQREAALSEKRAAIQALSAKAAPPDVVQRAQVELQRLQEDADAELTALGKQLQQELFRKVFPIVKQIGEEEHLGAVLEYPNLNFILWLGEPVDITSKVILRLDAADKGKP